MSTQLSPTIKCNVTGIPGFGLPFLRRGTEFCIKRIPDERSDIRGLSTSRGADAGYRLIARQTANPKFIRSRTFAKRVSSSRVIDWGGQPRNTPSRRSWPKGIAGSKWPMSRKSMTLTGVSLAPAMAESCAKQPNSQQRGEQGNREAIGRRSGGNRQADAGPVVLPFVAAATCQCARP